MKTHFYQTNENHMIAETRLFNNAQKNDWISTVMVDKTPVSDSFSGFGVAITGSSCYELSIMPPAFKTFGMPWVRLRIYLKML